jgi:hypothetical protein
VDGRRAASWLSGSGRKLAIVDSEAELVRSIFRRYAELGSVPLLRDELEARGIKGQSRMSVSGRLWGGKPFSRGALCYSRRNAFISGVASEVSI